MDSGLMYNFNVCSPTLMKLIPHLLVVKGGRWVRPILVLSDKVEFKIFQHYMYFSADRMMAQSVSEGWH